jgi:hypothetical protein
VAAAIASAPMNAGDALAAGQSRRREGTDVFDEGGRRAGGDLAP